MINYLRTHWRLAICILLAVVVYCYMAFVCPHVMVARESSQLFLWSWDYFLERLMLPGGLAQWVAEFLVQFFNNPYVGAFIYVILFALLPKILRWEGWLLAIGLLLLASCFYVPLTLTVAIVMVLSCWSEKDGWLMLAIKSAVLYWLAGPAVLLLAIRPRAKGWVWKSITVLLVTVSGIFLSSLFVPYPLTQIARGIDYYWEEEHKSTGEEMRYDMLVRMRDWDGIEQLSREEPPQSLAATNAVRLAQYYNKRLDGQMLYQELTTSNKVLRSEASAFLMSEIYLHTGMVNMSQRAVFEAMESIPNHNKSARALKRLTETSIATGQYEVALKYLSILDCTTFYRGWAAKMRAMALHPEQISQHDYYEKLQKAYAETKDMFFY